VDSGGRAGARILVVEDDPSVSRTVTRLLQSHGHACVAAGNAIEARQRIAEDGSFELVLCDVTMPGESGLELTRDILTEHPDLAVVMVTGLDDPALAEMALDSGAYGYVTKPFTHNELLINVANALWRRGLELENRAHRERLEHLVANRTVALRARESQQRAVAELGQRALYGIEMSALFATAINTVRAELDVPLGAVLELSRERDGMIVVGAEGWEAGALGTRLPVVRQWDACLAVATEEPVTFDQVDQAVCAPAPLGRESVTVESGLSVVIRLNNGPYGVLTVHSRERRVFTADDVSFAQSVANVLGNALARNRMEEQVRQQALHDPLTGLPNRAVLTDRLEHALGRVGRSDHSLALLFIDLDHFKNVNDSLGHGAGDQLLIKVAHRLRQLVRSGDTIARFGGDEFIVLCDELETGDAAAELATRFGNALDEPFTLGDDTVFVTASIGIALPNRERTTADALLRDADAAMYLAKEHGRARYEFFDATLRRRALERMRTETAMRWALERNELFVRYQPIVDLTDGQVVALEALVRWQDPERGLTMPDEFIPLCEATGLIVPLGAFVLREACAQLGRWIADGIATDDLCVNVNIAARQLTDPQFPDLVAAAIESSGIEARRLALEITETSIVEQGNRVGDTITRLQELGVRLVLDDFGTGYSSLSYIQRFPLDSIKLDRSFVQDLETDETQRALVAGITSIAHALGLQTVVEGIETQAQANIARDLGCGLAQGFLFSHAEDPDVLARYLGAGSHVAGSGLAVAAHRDGDDGG
jgi:diguanylate cyclase (GGDEF)-like protein